MFDGLQVEEIAEERGTLIIGIRYLIYHGTGTKSLFT
jgi:hypothetical protein